jgi:hypothetical protein
MTIRSDVVASPTGDYRRQTCIEEYSRVRFEPGPRETSLGWWYGEQSGEHG